MSVRLQVKQRAEEGGVAKESQELLLDEPVINLGRDKTSQVALPLQAVSRNHARISRDGALFFVEDLGSVYGTQVNGQTLPKGEKRLLRDGDVIGIAQFDIAFERLPDVPKDLPRHETAMVARHMVKSAMRALGNAEGPYFRMMNGPEEGKHIQINDAQELVFGRDDDVDVVLQDDLVSRRHAKVRRDWAGTHVEDLASRNGVRVNKKRITRKTLTDRDEVEIGGVKLLYVDPTEVEQSRSAPRSDLERIDTPPTSAVPEPPPEPSVADADAVPDEDEPSVVASPEADVARSDDPVDTLPPPEDPALAPPSQEGDATGMSASSDEEQLEDSAEPVKRQMGVPQYVVLGAAGVAAALVLALVLYILLGG